MYNKFFFSFLFFYFLFFSFLSKILQIVTRVYLYFCDLEAIEISDKACKRELPCCTFYITALFQCLVNMHTFSDLHCSQVTKARPMAMRAYYVEAFLVLRD